MPKSLQSLSERFWAKVDRSGDCWLWQAKRQPRGYGVFTTGGKPRQQPAHRVAYEITVGPIPHGLELDHLCRTPSCVNPIHLEPVTHKVNMLRGLGVGSQNAAKTHCVNGHEFDAANTYIRTPASAGRRSCRECGRIAQRNYQLRKKAA